MKTILSNRSPAFANNMSMGVSEVLSQMADGVFPATNRVFWGAFHKDTSNYPPPCRLPKFDSCNTCNPQTSWQMHYTAASEPDLDGGVKYCLPRSPSGCFSSLFMSGLGLLGLKSSGAILNITASSGCLIERNLAPDHPGFVLPGTYVLRTHSYVIGDHSFLTSIS